MNHDQAAAIAEMAENLHQYNRGVLAMLGKAQLAADHESASAMVEILCADRDRLIPESDHLLLDLPPAAAEIQQQIDAAVSRRRATWAPIQALIDDARARLDAADPLGLRDAGARA